MATVLPNGDNESFATRLRFHRRRAGLSQQELANRAGLTTKGVGALERGERQRPYPNTLRRLAEALALSESERATFFASVPPREPAVPVVTSESLEATGQRTLPGYLDSFIGRERETAAVRRLLQQPHIRLLTLTGPGGVGKTRLAVHVADKSSDVFPDGLVFVPLAAVRETHRITAAIAQALGVREDGSRPLRELLTAALETRSLLLLLDNFEHLVEAAPQVTDLLRQCPKITVLMTSRAPLHVQGEYLYPVPPLAIAEPESGTGEAIRLFVTRAQAVQPQFALTTTNAPAIAEICRRLDGLPLAIELAAARSTVLPPAVLLDRLDHALPLLAGGPRDQPARLRTMSDAIAWSFDLLSSPEQACFRQLGVFVGGWTLEGAAAIVARSGQNETAPPLIDVITRLLDHSLIRRAPADESEPRFTMLETIREYAVAQLAASGEANATRQRHAAYFLDLAELAESFLAGPEQQAWIDRLEAEHDNLRAALAWSAEANEVATGLRLAAALMQFWYVRGFLSEGRTWLASMAERARDDGAIAAPRAKALSGAAYLAAHMGDFEAAFAFGEAALAVARDIGDQPEIARALNRLATVASQRGENDRPIPLFTAALEVYREIGDRHGMANVLNNLGVIANERGEPEQAARYLDEALTIFRAHRDLRGIAVTLGNLGRTAIARGDLEQAAAHAEDAIALHRDVGYKRGQAIELDRLAEVRRRQGRLDRARVHHRASLPVWRAIDDPVDLAEWLEQVAFLETASGRPAFAARLLGATDALREGVGHAQSVASAGTDSEHARTLRQALGEARFVKAWERGRSLPLADALSQAEAALTDRVGSMTSTS